MAGNHPPPPATPLQDVAGRFVLSWLASAVEPHNVFKPPSEHENLPRVPVYRLTIFIPDGTKDRIVPALRAHYGDTRLYVPSSDAAFAKHEPFVGSAWAYRGMPLLTEVRSLEQFGNDVEAWKSHWLHTIKVSPAAVKRMGVDSHYTKHVRSFAVYAPPLRDDAQFVIAIESTRALGLDAEWLSDHIGKARNIFAHIARFTSILVELMQGIADGRWGRSRPEGDLVHSEVETARTDDALAGTLLVAAPPDHGERARPILPPPTERDGRSIFPPPPSDGRRVGGLPPLVRDDQASPVSLPAPASAVASSGEPPIPRDAPSERDPAVASTPSATVSMVAPRRTGVPTDIFISHDSADHRLAKSVLACIKGCFDLPDSAIRCTSVSGYGLRLGGKFRQQLLEDLESCKIVIVVVTPAIVGASWVQYEIGAAAMARKTTCCILAPGTSKDSIPTLADTEHVKIKDGNCMHRVIQLVSKSVPQYPPRTLELQHEAMADFRKHVSRAKGRRRTVPKSKS